MAWKNRNNSQVAQDEPGLKYPFVQWVNRGGDLDPRRQAGGWFMPEEALNMLDVLPVDAEAVMLNFSDGTSSAGVYAPQITIAPLISRFTWVKKIGGRQIHLPDYTDGARGKIQLLCYLQSEDGLRGPVFLTITGTVSKELYGAFKAHRQRVTLATKGQAPAPLFTMTLAADKPELRGKPGEQGTATPLVLLNDFDVDAAYVGDEMADEIEARWPEFKAWAAQWKQGAPPTEGDESGDYGEDADADAPPATPVQPAPARTQAPQKPAARPTAAAVGDMAQARDRWSAAWNALKKMGVTTAFMNPAHNAAQLNEAAEVMQAALADLHNGVDAESVTSALAIQLAQIGEG